MSKTFKIYISKLFAFVPFLLLVYTLKGKFSHFQYISIICIICIAWNTNISNPTSQYIGISNRIYVSRKSFLAFDCHPTEFAEQLTLLFPAHPYSTPWKYQGVEKGCIGNKWLKLLNFKNSNVSLLYLQHFFMILFKKLRHKYRFKVTDKDIWITSIVIALVSLILALKWYLSQRSSSNGPRRRI